MIDLAKLFGGTLGGTTYNLAPPEAVNATSFGTHTVSLPVQPDDYQLTYHTDSAPHGNVTTPGILMVVDNRGARTTTSPCRFWAIS